MEYDFKCPPPNQSLPSRSPQEACLGRNYKAKILQIHTDSLLKPKTFHLHIVLLSKRISPASRSVENYNALLCHQIVYVTLCSQTKMPENGISQILIKEIIQAHFIVSRRKKKKKTPCVFKQLLKLQENLHHNRFSFAQNLLYLKLAVGKLTMGPGPWLW